MQQNTELPSPLLQKMSPEMTEIGMADPALLTGTNISQFAEAQNLHLIELGMAFGVNTAALYTKKGADNLNSTLSLLVRLFSAFPEHLTRFKTPTYESLIGKITKIDPGFRPTHLGPLLGMEINSSHRLKTDGLEVSSPTVRSLAQLIDTLITIDPENWFVIKNAVEIEAKARKVVPADKIWKLGGWKKAIKKDAATRVKKEAGATKSASSTAQPLHRRKK
ncbi:hypothetical protein [Stutzerimonas stutzeri]|uniref:hypothetical protein n=1 Tax=Stutzerimonas stutzeri TaxID=316 RepID=UPI0015E41F41|nr:hypothetical protein [Stutzerimonas stutzeri]MBA1280218.1 hypothetical protein [Stutzerimonas stutzeri]